MKKVMTVCAVALMAFATLSGCAKRCCETPCEPPCKERIMKEYGCK